MFKRTICGAFAAAVMIGGLTAQAQTPVPPAPQDFVMAAGQSDQYEIMAAHLAEVQGQDPRVRSFAQDMIRDHTRMNEDLSQAAEKSGLQPPNSGLSSDQALLLSGLQGLRGGEFDKAYARQQMLAHAQAAAVEESFADAGADPTLKKAAQSALPMIKEHLQRAQQLHEQVGSH